MEVKRVIFDTSEIEFSRKDKIKGIILPQVFSFELSEDIGIHIGDGTMNIYPNPHGTDYYYKCSGHPENDKDWYDNFIIPLKKKLFNLRINAKKFSDGTYSIQFRSKAIILFYNKIIGLPLGYKAKTIDFPPLIKSSPLQYKIACLRGIFDTDFSVTFAKKYKEVHHYPVIKCEFASEAIVRSIKEILDKLNFYYSHGKYSSYDKRIKKNKIGYAIFISGKNQIEKWFKIVGSSNKNHITKFEVWKKFGFCPPRTTIKQRKLILLDKLDPLKLE